MTVEEIFALNLKRARKAAGLTQKALAERIVYSEKSVSKWEKGAAVPPGALLPLLADALRVPIDSLFESAQSPAYYLGIDGGGTKTDFLLADEEGRTCGALTLEGCNPVDVGLEKTCDVLARGINEVTKGVALRKISAFAGIAGGITGGNREKIAAFLAGFPFARCANGSDAENALAAALGDTDGIVVILGTGDIAYTRVRGKQHRTGGFGYLFDPGGSGYAIGRDGILSALADEQHGRASRLCRKIKAHYGTDDLCGSLSRLYDGGKALIASACPAVFSAANEGDAAAQRILDANMFAAASLIADASRFLDGQNVLAVLTGSVAAADGVTERIAAHLKTLDGKKTYTLSVLKKRPVTGALINAGLKKECTAC